MLDNNINNSFEQLLIDSKYSIYNDNFGKAIRLFQRKVEDDIGIKYYINCYHYNFFKQLNIGESDQDRYTFKVQFHSNNYNKDQVVDVSFGAEFVPSIYKTMTTLKEVEQFFENMFNKFKFDYNEIKM